MRQLNGVYTQRFNRRHERCGHVLQGRFGAQVVDGDAYLREVCRYIVLNPVRAGLVAHPGEWRWSSFRATAGETAVPGFLSVEWVRSLSGARTQTEAIRRFVSFVEAGIGAPENAVDRFSSKPVMSDGALVDQLGDQCREAVQCTSFLAPNASSQDLRSTASSGPLPQDPTGMPGRSRRFGTTGTR